MPSVLRVSRAKGSARRAAAAAALLAAGCTLAPRYQRPAAPVEDRWSAPEGGAPGAAAPGGGAAPGPAAGAGGAATDRTPRTIPAADLGWRDVFEDARIQALVALALQENRDLRATALNVELTRAQYRIQRAQLVPGVAAVATSASGRTPADLSTTGTAVTGTRYDLGVGVTGYELDLFGRVRSLSAAALETYLATEEARRSAQLALVAQVVNEELSARALDDSADLARRTVETSERSLGLTRRLFEAGRTSELDVSTAEAQLQAARVNLSQVEVQRQRAHNALVLLVGRPLPADLPPPRPIDAGALLRELPPGVPSEVLQRRPDILAAEHALVAANASIGAARAAFFPSITLTATAGTASASLSGLFGGGSGVWSFVPRIVQPLFEGGALRAGVDVAEARKSIQVARYEGAIQGAFREVSDALVGRAALDAQLEAQGARVRAEERRSQLSELRYSRGVDSFLTVLTAQRDLFTAQQALIQTRLARLTNLVDLYRALGGGWRERTAAPEAASAGPSRPAAPAERAGG